MGVSALSVRSDWRQPEYAVMRVAGEIDIATVGQITDELSQLLADGCRYLVVDLSMTGFCDASGLSSLIVAQDRVRARRGWLRLVGPQPIVRKLFHVTGLTAEFSFYDTLELATATVHTDTGSTVRHLPASGRRVPAPRRSGPAGPGAGSNGDAGTGVPGETRARTPGGTAGSARR
ncbi:MAG TPA: STAS domain-containing protein, partial [Mycobacteriales bacterium]